MSEKPRFRVLTNGWVRHDGLGRPDVLRGSDPVCCRSRGGVMRYMDGLPAYAFTGWRHTGFSGDILFWKPAMPEPDTLTNGPGVLAGRE